MAESLSYAAPMPWYRRRRWLFLLTALLLVVGYVLALPQYRVLRQHQVRRTEIRRQFRNEIAAARKALDAAQLSPAAVAVLHAEFPVRTERSLFWQSEVDRFQKELEPLRAKVLAMAVKARAVADQEMAKQEADLAKEMEEERRRGEVVLRCYLADRPMLVARLHVAAVERLSAHNYKDALAICDQIVALEPEHNFGDAFWASARPKP